MQTKIFQFNSIKNLNEVKECVEHAVQCTFHLELTVELVPGIDC